MNSKSTNNTALLKKHLSHALSDRAFLKAAGMTAAEVQSFTSSRVYGDFISHLLKATYNDGRFDTREVALLCNEYVASMAEEPIDGWLLHTYSHLLHNLFPHKPEPVDEEEKRAGRLVFLQILRGLFTYEREALPFDPTKDFIMLTDSEVSEGGYTSEYYRLHKLTKNRYVYEFMRIGIDITPFNTLGHVAGVHYVAMHAARQLADIGSPVDLALISGAAASHDIGKYGCRKGEERRTPYLHYFYTDQCLTHFGLPTIMHIAANHSTWDLELENLSVESLLLIYADFRVKSSRDSDGTEIVHFYSLKEAFDVILSKLDNVDEAKHHRYVKVYNKLKDFEDYMIDNGIDVNLPSVPKPYPPACCGRVKVQSALLHGNDVVDNLKYTAIKHNIRLMSYFNNPAEFSGLIEAARSSTNWKDIRTYITILDEYSSYMTEEQKSMTLRFLYEMLSHNESDIRVQSAAIMGKIAGRYREEYKKELPSNIPVPDINITNLDVFENYLQMFLNPGYKYTDVLKKRITSNTNIYVNATIESCRPSCRDKYFEILIREYNANSLSAHKVIVLSDLANTLCKEHVSMNFKYTVKDFVRKHLGVYDRDVDLILLNVADKYYPGDPEFNTSRRRNVLLGVADKSLGKSELLSSILLDNLKFNTPWTVKVANINYIISTISEESSRGEMLHIATHLANLIKVSETIAVRKAAGSALLSIASKMPFEQRNELTIELFNGLERGDYQFSKLIPDYLGIVTLMLPPRELDETIFELANLINAGSEMSASAALNTIGVMVENYGIYSSEESDEEKKSRFNHLLGLLIKGFAYHDSGISQEALRAIGEYVYNSEILSMDIKRDISSCIFKRILTLIADNDAGLVFYGNAACLNKIYRFISEYQSEIGDFNIGKPSKVAFFPGTFDPFSLGHKAIARTIRDMGYTVYLAIDEFSWSKKMLPHMLRREILSMSVADEEDMYIFPDDISINIANDNDIHKLKDVFKDFELYIAVGSDVVKNASSYKKKPTEDSIHTVNHIVFARESIEQEPSDLEVYPVTADVIKLTLKKYYEDISSTRIRDNIDRNLDIATLLDPIVQNYIYDNNLYSRQPTYKHVLQAQELKISDYSSKDSSFLLSLKDDLEHKNLDFEKLQEYVNRPKVKTITIENERKNNKLIAFASARRVETKDLLGEFGDTEITKRIRQNASGAIAVIGAFYASQTRSISNINQILISELASSLLAKDYSYAVYHPVDPAGMNQKTIDALRHQGFVNISSDSANPIYAVELVSPIVIFRDVETIIKAPLNKNPRVLKALEEAHYRLLRTFTELYPGKLIVSFNTSAVYSKIVDLVANYNGVSTIPDPLRRRGPYMSVPFGKALSDVIVPNTVTKALRTEKYFTNELSGFDIRELKDYTPLHDQVKMIKSFNRPVILIDDLLHKGQRINKIEPLLREENVEVQKIIVGLLTGNARDEMQIRGLDVESAYFMPDINMWLNEKDSYPFIGGDSIDSASGERDESINLILPYTSFSFVARNDHDASYRYSLTCLENAASILKVLEQEYQRTFEKKLTLRRLGAVISYPRRPILGEGLTYDENVAPSVYVESDIRKLKRLHLVKK